MRLEYQGLVFSESTGGEWYVDRVGVYRYVSVGLDEANRLLSLEISQKSEEPAVELWVQVMVMG